MLSLGSAAYLPDKTLVDTFSINLETLPGATGHPDTLEWWQTQPDAWEACRTDLESPESAINQYHDWLLSRKQSLSPIRWHSISCSLTGTCTNSLAQVRSDTQLWILKPTGWPYSNKFIFV